MTCSGIDELLADAVVPATPAMGFDVSAALRRLQAGLRNPGHRSRVREQQIREAREAEHTLDFICRWAVSRPGACGQLRGLADDWQLGIDVDGVFVFACLLRSAGYPDSAQFWWQLAAGASNRTASYCLHLHHLQLGEGRRAWHWFEQFRCMSPTKTLEADAGYVEMLAALARYFHRHGSAGRAVAEQVEDEVHRLAARTMRNWGVVGRPGRRFAQLFGVSRRVLKSGTAVGGWRLHSGA
ncbi:hypothetical protein [Streptomyces abikoensis]|uniref:Uncharacterized protein n=1 Tax=Streptomyces abikoensis TaxID=97398 RepID=A0ABW7TDB9_9ACTN